MSILPLLKNAKKSINQIANLSNDERSALVEAFAEALVLNTEAILAANKIDADRMADEDPKKDRLLLTTELIKAIANDSQNIADLEDPSGKIELERVLDSGIKLQKTTVPMGVVGMIYESRPNVTADTISLCLKSGNAAVLRGGSDANNSNKAIVEIAHQVLTEKNLDPNVITLLPTDRALVKEFLEAEKYVDILIPRGSQGLINFVRENAKIPTIETGAGVCHTFIDASADLKMAKDIVENAKLQRPSVCNALDTILVAAEVYKAFLPMIVESFSAKSVEIYADERSYEVLNTQKYPLLKKAEDNDFGREFLGYGCSIKIIDSFDQALDHIAENSSKHSEAIITKDEQLAEKFLRNVDAAAVYHNASTRFSDGGMFGLGAEIGISTQKLHARGPFALEKLVTEKWIGRGHGEVRT